ncbi:MAG: hypothetical protein IKU26_00305 [Clostridia bacterium]|nr:hypothetical protein [Clostridia bacterium]
MFKILLHPIFLWIVGFLLVSGLLLWIVSLFVASYCVYVSTLRKGNTWTREMPEDIDPEQIPMYQAGQVWSEANQAYKTDVHIVRDGLNLYGEYYDFGKKRCAMILSGRTESLKYGYYFAIPYAECDCNILVVDPRGHGLSDGEFNTVGFEESKDDIAWINYIRKTYGIESFILHGICIGAAGGMFALNNPDCPDCIHGIVTEGMFPRFSESVKNHMIEKRRSPFITLDLIDCWMKHYTGHSMKYGPLDIIHNIHTPLLMLHSKEDLYSTPEYAEKLFTASGASQKKLVWFEHGRHSMLRRTDTLLYDTSIKNFIAEISANGK